MMPFYMYKQLTDTGLWGMEFQFYEIKSYGDYCTILHIYEYEWIQPWHTLYFVKIENKKRRNNRGIEKKRIYMIFLSMNRFNYFYKVATWLTLKMPRYAALVQKFSTSLIGKITNVVQSHGNNPTKSNILSKNCTHPVHLYWHQNLNCTT